MRVAVLVAVTVVAWALAVPAAALLDSPGHWMAGSIAAVLCGIAAIGTLVMISATERRGTVVSLGAVMVAPVLRIAVVMAAGFAIGLAVPQLRAEPVRFVGWLLGFYLLTLIVETALVLPRAMKSPGTERTDGL